MPTPHKHAELIKKWADNPELVFEIYYPINGIWELIRGTPSWNESLNYRIKPKLDKREGWVLVHHKPTFSGCWALASNVFPTEQEAITAGKGRYNIAKVEWEEEVNE